MHRQNRTNPTRRQPPSDERREADDPTLNWRGERDEYLVALNDLSKRPRLFESNEDLWGV